nr:hypothetical protein Q903MT_gene753 [Picea sitchensis]
MVCCLLGNPFPPFLLVLKDVMPYLPYFLISKRISWWRLANLVCKQLRSIPYQEREKEPKLAMLKHLYIL